MYSGIADRLLIFRNVYVIFIADGEQHNMARKIVLYVCKVRDRIVGSSHCQYRLYSFDSSSEWSNSVHARFLLGSACNPSNQTGHRGTTDETKKRL